VLAAVALTSAGVSAGRFLDLVKSMRHDYADMNETQRDHVAVGAAGLQTEAWDFIRSHVRPSDRYAIETPDRRGEAFHRYMQTFAGYWLLPAVAVAQPDRANALVYIGERGPPGVACLEAPQPVCVRRQGS